MASPIPDSNSDSTTLRDISPRQWRSGIAAWLGWMFDGLDLHLYTLVALPFVASLMQLQDTTDAAVGRHASYIQGAFLLGWALGGAVFGWIGDRLGRSRTLSLTVLTYALFTGLSFFAGEWWHLLIFRFLAALGIGGEWAVGASLLSETWPRKWRPWIAAVLQCAVNVGILIAVLAYTLMSELPPKWLFLVGVLPAFAVFWMRKAVPETDEWHAAQTASAPKPGVADLLRGETRRITVWVVAVCALSLTAHWCFMYWHAQHLRNLPEVLAMDSATRNSLISKAFFIIIGCSILGNFFSGWVSRLLGYRATIAWTFAAYFVAMLGAYAVPRSHAELLWWFPLIGFCQGVFGLFTMYLPPLFPTLLRTTGAGFGYNIGRVAAAVGTIYFGSISKVGDHRSALLWASFLFPLAALSCLMMPKVRD